MNKSESDPRRVARAVCAAMSISLVITSLVFAQRQQLGKGAGVRTGAVNGKRLALLVGNADYARKPLHNPVNDAKAMAQVLQESGFEVMTGFNLTKAELEEKILQFGERLKADRGVGLFYYSGHGMQVDGENYLLPVEFDIDKVPDRRLAGNYAINIDLVLGNMDIAGNRFNLIILDACRDNPFEKSWKSVRSKGLATVEAPSGILMAYATAPNRTASEGIGVLSPYTASLVKQIRVEGQTIYDVFSNVGEEVEEHTDGKQKPWIASSLRGRAFCFRGCGLMSGGGDYNNSTSPDSPDRDTDSAKIKVEEVESAKIKVEEVERVTFDFANKVNAFVERSFGEKDHEFSTTWSEYNSSSVYLYIYGMKTLAKIPRGAYPKNAADSSKFPHTKYRAEILSVGDRAVVSNSNGRYAVIKVTSIRYSGPSKKVVFEYEILPD